MLPLLTHSSPTRRSSDLVFLHVLAIRQRQPLRDDEQRVERADHPPCLAADQLGGVGVALLRHDRAAGGEGIRQRDEAEAGRAPQHDRSEEHTSELQSLMLISYAVFCLKTKTNNTS